jgi:opacity protein-like surface antigen
MRKALIAAAVATALFAVGAFAASFDIDAEDIASGSDPVQSCAASAQVDFNESFRTAQNNWVIDTVTVTLAGADDCLGASVELVLQDNVPTEAIVYQNTKTVVAGDISGTTVTLTYTPPVDSLTVGQVWNAAILVDGFDIETV